MIYLCIDPAFFCIYSKSRLDRCFALLSLFFNSHFCFPVILPGFSYHIFISLYKYNLWLVVDFCGNSSRQGSCTYINIFGAICKTFLILSWTGRLIVCMYTVIKMMAVISFEKSGSLLFTTFLCHRSVLQGWDRLNYAWFDTISIYWNAISEREQIRKALSYILFVKNCFSRFWKASSLCRMCPTTILSMEQPVHIKEYPLRTGHIIFTSSSRKSLVRQKSRKIKEWPRCMV